MENINKKRIKIAMIVAIVGTISLLVGVSYAIFNTVLESSKNQVIKVGSIALRFTEENGGIELLNLEELTDEEGIASDNYYSFSIENVGSNDAYYEIKLIDDPTKTNTLSANYVRANVEVDGTSKPAVNIETSGRVIYQDTITAGTTKNYKLRIWLNFGSLTTEEKQALLNQEAYFKIKIVASQIVDNNLDKSGANKPELATGMIPVYYDETNEVWKKADETNIDSNNKWYDYNRKMWANAVTVSSTNRDTYMNADVGTPISMNDINTMWVWIPRFRATSTGSYNGGTKSSPGAFNITFVDNKTNAHDAFTFGAQSLNGFWVGKFETSHETLSSSETDNNLGCTNDTCSNASGIIIKPNVVSLRYNNVSNFYYASLSMKQSGNSFGFDTTKDTTLDTHMMKNNEWGAVAYLTQSIYGRCTSSTSCTEVYINNSESFYTGRSGETPGSSNTTSTTEGTYKYNENKIETSVVEGTGTNVSTTITNDSTYPWTNTDGVYSSSNNGQDSTTTTLTFSFTLSSKGVVSFDYSVSSDKTWRSWDEMSYTINNGTTDVITGDKISGTTRGTEESSLSYDNKVHILDAGTYTLTFTYSKDSSNADGLDKGYVKNLVILDEVEIITKEVPKGQLASTTGNIYGVYDMSGGAHEYVMGVYTDGTQNWSGGTSNNSGFSGCLGSDCSSTYDGVAYPESKYYNSYTNTGTSGSPITNYTSDMQHALTETKNWFGDYAYFVNGSNPWFRRGGYYYDGSYAGVFYCSYYDGDSYSNYSSRSSLIIN